MGKLKEYLFGEYDSVDRAVQFPKSVRELIVSFPENLNDYSAEFSRFVNLQSLHIQTHVKHVPYVPEQIGGLTGLKKLSTLNVPFVEFPKWIFNLKNLEYLRVRGCEITDVPVGITNLDKLKTLRIENCDLKVLPPGFKLMRSVKHLSLTDTLVQNIKLEDLPPNLKVLEINKGAMSSGLLNKVKDFVPTLKILVV